MQYEISKDDYIKGGTEKDFYSPDEVESCLCPLCNSSQFTTIHKERGNIGVVICKSCELIYTNPRVKNSSENYFGAEAIYYEEARLIFKGKKTHHRDRNYEYELREIKKIKPSGKLLDIGPNMGFFLRKAVGFGFEAEGVEPSTSLGDIARREFGLKITNSFFEKSVFPDKSFDIITMIDVFEHVSNPKDILAAAHDVLRDDGMICIKVPNGNYNILKLKLGKMMGRMESHDIFDSYEHVVYYTPPTMKKMLEENGFKI
jgi:2-polyprenyl-3-methyl-5-hydroxy-6-metoxy-1,4-benzoquinol methylase